VIRALAIVALVASTASAKPCELPAPAAGARTVRVDLDGDHADDALVPIGCDPDGECTYAVYLARATCRPLGELRATSAPRALPLTSAGIALVSAGVHDPGDDLAVYAWDGGGFARIYAGCVPSGGPDEPDDTLCTEAFLPTAKPICLRGREAASFDVDGDGARDVFVDVPCTVGLPCGNWLLLARRRCLTPASIFGDGKVVRVAPASRGKPARFRVGAYETQFTPRAQNGG
jgi:hypothetical protein